MAKLISDFFCVAESGSTIDNREIKPEWLLQAARDYNADFYAARLWFEHIRYFGAMGDVFAVKTEKDEATGIVRLYNRIIPSPELLQMKQKGMALYSSIELTKKLERTNGVYQKGLGVTDSPASFSTERLEFTASKLDEGAILTPALELSDLHFSAERSVFSFFDKKKEQADLNAFNEAFSNEGVDGSNPPNNSQNPPDQELDMNADDVKALFKDALASFKTELKQELKQDFADELKEKVTDKVKADFTEQLDSKLEKAFEDKFKPMLEKIDAQDEKFTELGAKQDEIITLAKKPGGDDDDNNHHDRDEHGGGDDNEVFTH